MVIISTDRVRLPKKVSAIMHEYQWTSEYYDDIVCIISQIDNLHQSSRKWHCFNPEENYTELLQNLPDLDPICELGRDPFWVPWAATAITGVGGRITLSSPYRSFPCKPGAGLVGAAPTV